MALEVPICRTRREFLSRAAVSVLPGALVACQVAEIKPVVSVVRIRKGNIEAAVEQAIELLGGMAAITRGKERIMLKPNLVAIKQRGGGDLIKRSAGSDTIIDRRVGNYRLPPVDPKP